MSSGKYRKEHNCLNCGSHVEKHYCSSCGQPNLELKENFWAFITHSIAHYFHFENKFFQTLKPLILQPGQVTLDYLAGKRARYINPVSMYIFVSIVYFLVVPSGNHHENEDKNVHTKEAVEVAKKNIDSLDLKKELAKDGIHVNGFLDKAVSMATLNFQYSEFKKLNFQDQQSVIAGLKKRNDSLKSDTLSVIIAEYEELHTVKQDSTYEAYLLRQKKLSEDEQDNWFDRLLKKRSISVNHKTATGFWSLSEEVEHYRPKQYFLLMPLLAFFIMRIFRKNKFYYLDHLIFTIHGMTAFFILKIVTVPLQQYVFGATSVVSTLIKWLVFGATAWYMYKGLSIFYKRSMNSTIKKMILVCLLYWIAFKLSEIVIEKIIYYFLA